MTPADEATFIALWTEGLAIAAIAQRLGIPVGTVKSRAHTLAHAGKLTPRPRGGAYPRQQALARQEDPPAPPAGARKDIQQWTVRLSKALIDHLKAVAYERRMPPSQLVEELLWKVLSDRRSSTSSSFERS